MSISIEKTYESFSGFTSGSTWVMRRYRADFRNVYRYYGVSQENIRQHTKRFEENFKTGIFHSKMALVRET